MLTVIPAYGRDYKTAKAARADWNADLDFIIANLFHAYDGKPCNRQDCGETSVMIRFSNLTKTTVVKGGVK